MFSWEVTSPIEGTYRVKDKPWDTVVWFYEVDQRWECEDCLQSNCPHISSAKKFKREGGAYEKFNRPEGGAVKTGVLKDDETFSTSYPTITT